MGIGAGLCVNVIFQVLVLLLENESGTCLETTAPRQLVHKHDVARTGGRVLRGTGEPLLRPICLPPSPRGSYSLTLTPYDQSNVVSNGNACANSSIPCFQLVLGIINGGCHVFHVYNIR